MTSSAGLDRLRAAVVDGRAENVRYRQNELQKLHQALRQNEERIRKAIAEDSQSDLFARLSAESEAEYWHTMRAVREFYSSLDFKKLLHDEYLIANDADNLSRRVGKGLVVIKPTTHTRLYSIICPIAAAITAGNCVCLELEDTILNVDKILKEVLPEALDFDTFLVTSQPVQHLSSAFLVDQSSKKVDPTLSELISNPTSRSIAIVDRAANVDQAAKSIINARVSFQGSSPYSPDIVLVNDFVKSKFIDACVKYATRFATGSSRARRQQDSNPIKQTVSDAEQSRQITTLESSGFTLVDIKHRNSSIAKIKVIGHYLPILECTSLLDAIMYQKSESTLLVAYLFSDPPAAKFLAQHLDAATTYINHIPLHLLLGPAAPITLLPCLSGHKYIPEMFSTSQPQIITTPTKELHLLEELLNGSNSGNGEVLMKRIRKEADEPLPPTGQPLGHAIGFFEQGIFIGVGLFLSIAVPSIAYGTYVLGRGAWKFARRI